MKLLAVFLLAFVVLANGAQAKEALCIDKAITQTRAKIQAHYAKQGMDVSLPWISSVDLDNTTSNGPYFEGVEYEPVWYTSYIIVGTLVIKGQGKFNDYAFYVRLNEETCDVLKVALLRTGKSPYWAISTQSTTQASEGGLAGQQIKVEEVKTPTDGSPQIGYTYAGPDEKSVPVVVHETHLNFLRERAEQLVRKY